jgi:predicted DNA-binding transcriptional regulator YafY
MDAIQQALVLTKTSKSIARKELDGFIGQGYGIFAGNKVQWAKLRFSAERARWVSRELWHPQQKIIENIDGSLILEVPFTDIRELSMDILRQGRHVEVLAPKELRNEVVKELQSALNTYAV